MTAPAAYCAACGTAMHAEEIHCDDCADDLREDEGWTGPPLDGDGGAELACACGGALDTNAHGIAACEETEDLGQLIVKAHDLKCWPTYFNALRNGRKTFEVRWDDRDYRVGDRLNILEWDNNREAYTGRELYRRVTYVLAGDGSTGIKPGYVVMGTRPIVAINQPSPSRSPDTPAAGSDERGEKP